jgi:hypothetical protein
VDEKLKLQPQARLTRVAYPIQSSGWSRAGNDGLRL